MSDESTPDPGGERNAEIWRSILTGEDPSLPALRRRFRRIPSDPRWKLCAAPSAGLAGASPG